MGSAARWDLDDLATDMLVLGLSSGPGASGAPVSATHPLGGADDEDVDGVGNHPTELPQAIALFLTSMAKKKP